MNETGNSMDNSAKSVPWFKPATIPAHRRRGFVYFATDGELIKVGFSVGPPVRVRGLKFPSGKSGKLLGQFPGYMDEEQNIHKILAPSLVHGNEWFRRDELVLHLLADLRKHLRRIQLERMTINDLIFERYLEEFDVEKPKSPIPTNATAFKKWVEQCQPDWPAELHVKAYQAWRELDGSGYKPPVGAVQEFEAAHLAWEAQYRIVPSEQG